MTLGLVFAGQLAAVAQRLAFGGGVPRQIANAHLLFNLLGVALVLPFTPWIARALERMIPDRDERPRRAPATIPAVSEA